MAFVPKLPTWHNTVSVYRKTAGNWALNGTITGQVYTPLRNSENEADGMIYLQYRKEDVASLRDPFDGVADVVAFAFPGGAVKGFRVVEILPRWHEFPNAHLIATLKRMTAAEFTAVLENGDVPDPDEPSPPATVPIATYLKATAAGEWAVGPEISGTIRLPDFAQPGTPFGTLYLLYNVADNVLRDATQLNQDPFYDTLGELDVVEFEYPSGSADLHRYKVMQVIPARLGNDDEHLVALIKRLTTTEADDMEVIEPPEPSDWPDDWSIEIAGTTDGTCSDCEALDDTYIIPTVDAGDVWESDPFAGACSSAIRWKILRVDPDVLDVILYDDDLPGNIAQWQLTGGYLSWDGVSPLVLDLNAGLSTDRCTWPATISITPA